MAFEASADALAMELGKAQASPLELLLIDLVVMRWLDLQDAEYRRAAALKGNMGIEQADHWEKRLTLVQHRYTQAVESLAKVRALLRRAPVQVNIAQRQVVVNNSAVGDSV